jgi:hypothetical protein
LPNGAVTTETVTEVAAVAIVDLGLANSPAAYRAVAAEPTAQAQLAARMVAGKAAWTQAHHMAGRKAIYLDSAQRAARRRDPGTPQPRADARHAAAVSGHGGRRSVRWVLRPDGIRLGSEQAGLHGAGVDLRPARHQTLVANPSQ